MKGKMLVACEFSGVVRSAFKAQGWDAWSCDLLPTEIPGQHIVDDVRNVLDWGWDLMIAHPPCTYLSYAANHVWNEPGRAYKRQEAYALFMACYNAPISHICVENPNGFPSEAFRKSDQVIHPYYFGDRVLKRTCLWLKNLPLLQPTQYTEYPEALYTHLREPSKYYTGREIKKRHFVDYGSKDAHERSKTFSGIASAMAAQWSNLDTLPIQYNLFEDAS
jgi:hypothetical protein